MTLSSLAVQSSTKLPVRREKTQETNQDGWRVFEVVNQTVVRCLQEVCTLLALNDK